jgi:hypothetical protein
MRKILIVIVVVMLSAPAVWGEEKQKLDQSWAKGLYDGKNQELKPMSEADKDLQLLIDGLLIKPKEKQEVDRSWTKGLKRD